jgi:predicted NBD/HSP70 family sugar kinase
MAEVTNLDPKRRHGASTEAVRAHNRRIVLNLIRQKQPISRADLARQSGLQRSTISLIVEELVAENWVIEGPTGRLPRGRRPTFLRLNEKRAIVAVDVRPIHTTIGLSDVNGQFLARKAFLTPADPHEGVQRIIQEVQSLLSGWEGAAAEGIGISVAGRVEANSNKLIFAPNLRWVDVDLKTPIAAATGLTVDIENAANACALSTVWFDHARDHRDIVVVTISEGLGTGVYSNGHLIRGSQGMAGEFGHVPLDPQGPECTCGGRGCWEVFASNRAGLRYYHELSGSDRPLLFNDLLALADEGDAHAVQALERMARYLGRGMRMLVAGLAPERIVVVGDLTKSWQRFGPIIEAEVQAQTLTGATPAQVVAAHEEGTARLRGTVALVLQKHFATAI